MAEPSNRLKAPGLACGISEPMIRDLVDAFYARVRADDLLGPIFEHHVTNWPDHLAKLTDFWSSVTLMSGRYKGRPMPVHAAIPNIAQSHFERWLELFRTTAQECCPPGAAALFIDRAERIAESLQLGLHRMRSGAIPLSKDQQSPQKITSC